MTSRSPEVERREAGKLTRAFCLCVSLAVTSTGCALVADQVDDRLNSVDAGMAAPSELDRHQQHRSLFVADLHADTLMWDRDLLRRGRWGHVDVPRLQKGGVDLQVFTAVTKTPSEAHRNGPASPPCIPFDGLNTTGVLSVAQGRPVSTWSDLRARAMFQARRLDDVAARSRQHGAIEVLRIRTAQDLARVVAVARAPSGARAERHILGALLGLEGANWIGGPEVTEDAVRQDVRDLHAAGFRTFALTHRFDNALAGASEGCEAYGLTAQGAAALEEAERIGMVIDLAHLAPRALAAALPLLRHPAFVTHTGVQASCPAPSCSPARNLADRELIEIARGGGVIGIGFWPEAVGDGGTAAIVTSFARAADVLRSAGFDPWDHLAFGSDFDGAVSVPFDASGLPHLIEALQRGGSEAPPVPDDGLARIAGGNVCRVLALRLEGGGAALATELCNPMWQRQ